ncbi:MAG: helix-turn-helix transcriptional regulator [Proteobacteria bacterium]|nr:helix-turn-helix transcriptional regulator [Pseudomonadota bacterium]
MPAPRSASAARIGSQVRTLRMATGISGNVLAKRSDISPSVLSRIEHGLIGASVETLERIAGGLGVPVSRLFSDQASRTDFSLVQAGRGILVDRVGAVAGYRYELLGHRLSGNLDVEPYMVTLLPEAEPYAAFQHQGVKLMQLVTGRVSYRYGSKVVTLEPGDTLLFDADLLHGIEEIVERPVTYLSVVFALRD